MPAIRVRRLSLAIAVLLVVWVGIGTLPAFADGPIRVGLYVQFEDGSIFTQCVGLDAPEATGLDVLRQAGVDLIFETGRGMGTTVCKIDATGCDYPAENCFCQCLSSQCQYWTYWYAEEGEWKYSPLGVSNRIVKDGDVEGWVWGNGQKSPPMEVLTEGLCSPSATPALLEEPPGEDSLPPATRASIAPTLTRAESRAESETGGASSQSQSPLPIETDLPPPMSPAPVEASLEGGSPAFVGLIIGMSGLGIVLLGLAYFVTRGRR